MCTHFPTPQLKSSSAPEEDTQVSGEEKEYVMANTKITPTASGQAVAEAAAADPHFSPMSNATQIPWKLLLSRKEVRTWGALFPAVQGF